MIFILVSNTDQNEIDGVDDEYQVEVVRCGDDLLLDSTFQEPTSDNINQNELTEPGKDLFYILFIFLLYICIQLAYYIFNSLLLSETSWAKYTPGMLRQPKSTPLSFARTSHKDDVDFSESGNY